MQITPGNKRMAAVQRRALAKLGLGTGGNKRAVGIVNFHGAVFFEHGLDLARVTDDNHLQSVRV